MEKEDLGLNLSLGFTHPNPSKSLSSSSPSSVLSLQKLPSLPSVADLNPRFLRGIDVNRAPSTADCEEDGDIISSPNSTVSCVSGKRNEREGNLGEDQEMAERGYCRRGFSDEEEEEGGENSRKKLRLSKDQSAFLEDAFKKHYTLNPNRKLALAKKLGLRPRQVEVWFQNRRARSKLKQTEVDREHLRLSCETLTEENRRLQKEAAELRALKLSPRLYDSAQMVPPTTLTMCPSCEPVAAPPRFATVAAHYRRSNPWVPGPTPPSDVLRL